MYNPYEYCLQIIGFRKLQALIEAYNSNNKVRYLCKILQVSLIGYTNFVNYRSELNSTDNFLTKFMEKNCCSKINPATTNVIRNPLFVFLVPWIKIGVLYIFRRAKT